MGFFGIIVDMTWASKRQFSYMALLLILVSIFLYFFVYPLFQKKPTCFDGKQNGVETGVDCGGECLLACADQVDKLSVLWSRVFNVADGRYNAVAYLENHNENNAVYKVKYKFRFADKNNVYIGSREGEAYIPPRGKFAIFEPALGFGHSVPVYTSFAFTEQPVWVQIDKEKNRQLNISIGNIDLSGEDVKPKLSAVLSNKSLLSIPNIEIIAILYDDLGNAINASSTFVDVLSPEEKQNIFFTWPSPFGKKVFTKEIIPIFNIFEVN